jgi:hypothetical protein
LKRLLEFDWDVLAGITAAVVALVLHLFHVVDGGVVTGILLVLVALILIRDLRREHREEKLTDSVLRSESMLQSLKASLSPPDVLLVGPHHLRKETTQYCAQSQGEMLWFNVCLLMFRPQALFDEMLKPAIENPKVTSLAFILDESEKERWDKEVLPKIKQCRGAEKVLPPQWCHLKESVSFILSDVLPAGERQGLLSFWGEPFMSRSTGQDIPRYVFKVLAHSELIVRLTEMARSYRLKK